MPLTGLVCPPGSPTAGTRNTIEHCLGSCPHPCVLPPVMGKLWRDATRNYHQGAYISASMIAGENCARQTYYERFEDGYYELPQKLLWPWRGTLAHAVVESAGDLVKEFGWIQELKLETTLQYPDIAAPIFDEQGVFTGDLDHQRCLEITVRGTTDAYNPIRRWLGDVKTMGDTKIDDLLKGRNKGEHSTQIKDTWTAQFNIYRWLVARTPIPDTIRAEFAARGTPLKGKNFPAPNKLFMQGIGMMDFPLSGTRYALRETDPSSKRRVTNMYDVDAVPVWQLTDIEAYVRPKALYWYKVLVLKQLPAPVPKAKQWLCAGCAFNGDKLEGERCHPTAK